tara:strand:- start:251 stop:649 length:399 start_codon:yes stop_codon:yes gene_type:complete
MSRIVKNGFADVSNTLSNDSWFDSDLFSDNSTSQPYTFGLTASNNVIGGLPIGSASVLGFNGELYSQDGYKRNSKDVNNPYNVISSRNITMKNVDFPVLGIDNLGNSRIMWPEEDYIFEGDKVLEIPMKQKF